MPQLRGRAHAAGELPADDLEAALVEIAVLREVEEAEPAPQPAPSSPAPTTFEDMLETFTQAVAAANAYEPPPTTTAASEAKAEAVLAELDVLYDEWIAALEAVHEAHTDVWERRWAGDKVTNARGDRLRMRSSLTNDGTTYAASRKYEGVARSANFRQIMIRDGIALAERTLAAMLAYAQNAGSQGPTGQPPTESPR